MFFTILANTDVFSISFMDPKWPTFLPKVRSQAAARQLSKSTMGVIRHNNGRGDHLKRDSGGWIDLQNLSEFFSPPRYYDLAPIEEYVQEHGGLFHSTSLARVGAFIACYSGESGSRISLLMAVRVTKVESMGEGKRHPVQTTLRCYLRPVALRACGGITDQNQRFLQQSRFNLRVTPGLMQGVPGLFHVNTEQAWGSILREGLKAGADLPNKGRREGRCDIHLLTSHPVSDQFTNERFRK